MAYAMGCSNVSCVDDSGFAEAVAVAKSAHAVVLVVGLDQTQERYTYSTAL